MSVGSPPSPVWTILAPFIAALAVGLVMRFTDPAPAQARGTLEADVATLKEDMREVKGDIKDLLKRGGE
jgi:hypothetical protein